MFVTLMENKTPKMVTFKGRFQLAHVYSVLDLESTSQPWEVDVFEGGDGCLITWGESDALGHIEVF